MRGNDLLKELVRDRDSLLVGDRNQNKPPRETANDDHNILVPEGLRKRPLQVHTKSVHGVHDVLWVELASVDPPVTLIFLALWARPTVA